MHHSGRQNIESNLPVEAVCEMLAKLCRKEKLQRVEALAGSAKPQRRVFRLAQGGGILLP
jgi:hypothetical protein